MGRIALSSLCARRLPRRRGVITLELILWLPIMGIFVLAIVEFALIMQFNKQVAYASRFGAKLASEITRDPAAAQNLANFNTSTTANNLKDRIDTYLANHGITASCEVQLIHNACVGGQSQTDTDQACNCGASGSGLPAGEPANPDEAYVKVTVCVPLPGNVPNCLATFGFDINGPNGTAGDADDCTIEHSTTFRVETNNADPSAVLTVPMQGLPGTLTAVPDFTAADVSCPPTTVITITADAADAGTAVPLSFNANSSTDLEDPFGSLTFAWTATGNPAGAAATYNATFTMPAAGATTSVFVNLTVTDTCAGTAGHGLRLDLVTNP